ncbi:MAG: acyl dehydratase [Rhodospirillaceae bacterium]|nr:acyl dehydratase [Magnetovibrio sp.]MAY67810.1 acyl dehydratase [Rhodospirillaceae bacterium]
MDALYFEDFTPGRKFRTRGMTLTESQIMEFAWQWDPQPFHVDAEAAGASQFGGIIGSGFQTLLVAFRLWFQENIMNECSMGSPGLDEIRWLLPVRPGDTLHVEAEVLESRTSESKLDRGYTKIKYAVVTHKGDTVMTYVANHIFARHPAGDDRRI